MSYQANHTPISLDLIIISPDSGIFSVVHTHIIRINKNVPLSQFKRSYK